MSKVLGLQRSIGAVPVLPAQRFQRLQQHSSFLPCTTFLQRPSRSATPTTRHAATHVTATAEAPVKKRAGRKRGEKAQMPSPGPYQQTLKRSFTIGGIGLHTGEYAYVRVRPALAGEGRYFVRVPSGTNSPRFQFEEAEGMEMEDFEEEALDPVGDDTTVQLFLHYLKAQDAGYEGSFNEYVGEEVAGQLPPEEEEVGEEEEAVARSEDEPYVLATLDYVFERNPHYTVLGQGDMEVIGVEHLLSALECMGVDNARIEIEGGSEVPVIDGSAQGWCVDIHMAGLRLAAYGDKDKVRKVALAPKQVISVRDGDAFLTLYPDSKTNLSYGIDHKGEAPIIGKQWVSWAPEEDDHYRWCLAPARTYAPSIAALIEMREAGYLKGGAELSHVIGHGDRWHDPQQVRFYDDEPVRHKMVDLIGDLSLLSQGGHCGLPLGHVVAYRADHDLHIRFAQALKQACGDGDYVPVQIK